MVHAGPELRMAEGVAQHSTADDHDGSIPEQVPGGRGRTLVQWALARISQESQSGAQGDCVQRVARQPHV